MGCLLWQEPLCLGTIVPTSRLLVSSSSSIGMTFFSAHFRLFSLRPGTCKTALGEGERVAFLHRRTYLRQYCMYYTYTSTGTLRRTYKVNSNSPDTAEGQRRVWRKRPKQRLFLCTRWMMSFFCVVLALKENTFRLLGTSSTVKGRFVVFAV